MRLNLLAAAVAVIVGVPLIDAVQLDVNSADSIRQASSVVARTLLAYYTNNQPSTPADQVGIIQVPPLYWWESGAVWGGMIDYWAYTGDETYVGDTQRGLIAQIGPDRNFQPPAFRTSTGNDDQAFWALSALSGLEYGFPAPSGQPSSVWLDLAVATFNSQTPRWDTSICGGGLRWQIYSDMNGYEYKNSVSNGALFQIAARLARYTGDQVYVDWSNKIWDWMLQANFMDTDYNVYDGAQITDNCANINRIIWTYNTGLMLYGSAMLYNYTGQDTWRERTIGLTNAATRRFFNPPEGPSGVLFERPCEPLDTCSYDQFAFKGFLSRWMAKSAIVAPFIYGDVQPLLASSAQAAAQACVGGASGSECGTKWYVGGYDGGKAGIPSVGQALSSLETIQSLLLLNGAAPRRAPAGNGQFQANEASSSAVPSSSSTSSSSQGVPFTFTSTSTPASTLTSTTSSSTTSITMTSSTRLTVIISTTTSTSSSTTSTSSTTSSSSTSTSITPTTPTLLFTFNSTTRMTSTSFTSSNTTFAFTMTTAPDPTIQPETTTNNAPAPPATSSGFASPASPFRQSTCFPQIGGTLFSNIPILSVFILAGVLFL